MAHIAVSDEVNTRLEAFKPVVEAIIQEPMSIEDYVALLLDRALDSMLNDLLGSLDPSVLVQSFQQLAAKHPSEVYSFVVGTLNAGATIDRDRLRRQIGFQPPEPSDA
jgi:hypothetical protein